jgi:hypothetical protein
MAAVALDYFAYIFIKIRSTLRVSPAMAAGVTNRLCDVADLVALLVKLESRKAAYWARIRRMGDPHMTDYRQRMSLLDKKMMEVLKRMDAFIDKGTVPSELVIEWEKLVTRAEEITQRYAKPSDLGR